MNKQIRFKFFLFKCNLKKLENQYQLQSSPVNRSIVQILEQFRLKWQDPLDF